MKTTIGWLKDFVDISVDARDYAEAMTLSGSKVEGVHDMGGAIDKVVVGKIVSIEKHPDADKLRICRVDVGSEILQIVTGAPNVKEGDSIPLALVGAKLPGGVIKASKLRGVESFGMMCSIEELNLTKDYLPDAPEYGVYVFTSNPPEPGTDVKKALELDTVVEFEITSNRPDCFSVLGLARESAATLGKPFNKPKITVREEGEGRAADYAGVSISNPELCFRYTARVVTDIKVEPSPAWMQRRLSAAGMRPVNNIVDITNYVMLEYGQPMHAFDLANVKDASIVVRTAREGEVLKTLDGQDRKLDPTMLVIADGEKPVGIAGVMGGENSEITSATSTILLESATFKGTSVRITGKKLGLRSEASSRFEKGLDTENAITALNRCAELIELLGAGKVVKGVIDCNPSEGALRRLPFEPDRINAYLGSAIPVEKMVEIFESLEFVVDTKAMLLTVPSFRPDIEQFADLSEEVARFYGYNNITPSLMSGKESTQGRKSYKQKMEDVIKNALTGCGFYEACTLSFTSPKVFDLLCLPASDLRRKAVVISNPLGEDYSIMRTTMLPEMLKTLALNSSRKIAGARLFELAYTYHPVEGETLPEEKERLALGLYGPGEDFFDLKGAVEQLLMVMGIEDYEFVPEKTAPEFHPGRTARLLVKSSDGSVKDGGILGEIHPDVAEKTECPGRTYAAQLDASVLIEASVAVKQSRSLPRFPAIERDLAVVIKDELYVNELIKTIRSKGGEFLESVQLFDVYKGSQVQEGSKSAAFALTFRASDRTLKDDEVNQAMERILKALEKSFDAKLR